MTEKRYAIVRVDNHCPEGLYENIKPNTLCPKDGDCEKCKYGDTKEQLVRKIAQVLLREELEWYRENLDIIPKGKIDEPLVRNLYERCLDKARKIIEFMGVEE